MNARTVAVIGGNGRVGSHVTDLLAAAGHTVKSLSRSTGVDVTTGRGLADSVAGADCIIDASSTPSADERTAVEYFTAAARAVQAAAGDAGIGRIVAVSIIGVDRFGSGYNLGKIAHERELLARPVPVTIVRAAQFHEFVPLLVEWGTKGDNAYVQKMRTQLVSARTVAEVLVDQAIREDPLVTVAGDITTMPHVAGPRTEWLPSAAQLWIEARELSVRVQAVSDPVDAERFEGDALLPPAGALLAGPTFAEWVASGNA